MKPLVKFKIWWFVAFIFIGFAFVLVLHYYQPPPQTSGLSQVNSDPSNVPPPNPIKVKAVICLDINRYDEPLEVKSEFGNPDYVFCHATFEDVPNDQQITFRWLYGNRQIAKIDASVNSGEDVVWSRFNFPEEKRGKWTAEILTKSGTLLASAPFNVKGFFE